MISPGRPRLFAYAVFLTFAVLLAGCVPGGNNDVQRQLAGNQGLLLVLQNSQELDHLYLYYGGDQVPVGGERQLPTPGVRTNSPEGFAQVGELNLLVHNVGQSATAGGIFISGYDPNLVKVCSRGSVIDSEGRCVGGPDPINDARSNQTCLHDIVINGDQYDVVVYCERNDGLDYGFRVSENGDRQSQTAVLGGLGLDAWADRIAGAVTGENVEWFSRNGVFGEGRVEVTNVDGRLGVRVIFGNPAGDPNRALRGFYLLNMLYGEILNCEENCRRFPPRFSSGQVLLGVSDLSPMGDALYLDYDVYVDREKWPAQINDLQQTFQVTACYYYTTTLTPTVCVDPDPGNNRGDPCTTGPLLFREPQGAPITVSRIDQRAIPGGTLFTINLNHVGNGRFWEPGSLPLCGPYSSARPDPRREDVVHLLHARMAGDLLPLDCSPKNENGYGTTTVRFQNGAAQVTCTYRPALSGIAGPRQAYESAMTLEFGYLYQNSILKRTVVHRS